MFRKDTVYLGYSTFDLPFSEYASEYSWILTPNKMLSRNALSKLSGCEISEINIKFKRNDFDGYYKVNIVRDFEDDSLDDLEEC